ncbi:MAG: substrate-binding domain-containing protein [Clostridiales bacterium]|nr:substrate-binding domain-containing protein [Clostridiales bacterium]
MNSLNLKIKKICVLLALLIFIFSLTACENGNSQAPAFLSGNIHIVTREEGSGTRSAFIELFKIEETDEHGGKIDNTVLTAETTNSTSVILATVASSLKSIGCTSMGSLSGTVKTVSIDGITPDLENVKNGSYKISRPFGIIFKSSISAAAQDFINFIFSENGQKTIEENGYISV